VLVLIQVGLFYLLRSRAGLYLRAIRDDEIAAASRGVRIVYWKTFAFTLSAAISGLAARALRAFRAIRQPELGLISQTGLIISMW